MSQLPSLSELKVLCVGFDRIERQKWNFNFHNDVFSLVYNHWKLRIVVLLAPLNEPLISTEVVGLFPWRPLRCSAMFLTQPDCKSIFWGGDNNIRE